MVDKSIDQGKKGMWKAKEHKGEKKEMIKQVRDTNIKIWEEFTQKTNYKTCRGVEKYAKIRHRKIIKEIREEDRTLVTLEGIA